MAAPASPVTRTPARAWTRARTIAGGLLVLAAASFGSGAPSNAASGGSVVGATVPGATSIANWCTSSDATDLGSFTPGTTSLTDTASPCSFLFGSSNSTATARIYQRDRVGSAMGTRDYASWTDVSDSFVAFKALDVVDATYAFRGYSDGTIARTDDAGTTWTPETSGFSGSVNSIAAIDEDTAYAVGGDAGPQIATRSVGGGSTWTTRTPPGGLTGTLTEIAVDPTDPDIAIAAGGDGSGGYLIRTTDGGASWNQVYGTGLRMLHVTILDGTLAYASGFLNELVRSTDGGATWSPVAVPLTSGLAIGDLHLNTGPVLWMGHTDGLVRSTNPAAATPTFTVLEATPLVACGFGTISSPSPSVVFAARSCNGGSVMRSIDATAGTPTFSSSQVPTSNAPFQLDAISASSAMASAGGALMSTVNGTTWTLDESVRGEYRAIEAWSAQDIAIAGGLGYVYWTDDGGSSWTTRTVGTSVHLNDILMVDADTAWVVGTNGSVYSTADSGATWTPHPLGTSTRLQSITRTVSGALVVVGDGGFARRSGDDGATWQAIDLQTAADVLVVDAVSDGNELWALPFGTNTVRRSTDDGRTWTVVTVPAATQPTTLSAPLDGVVWVGEGTNVYVSTTHGASWTTRATPHAVYRLDAIDASRATAGTGYIARPFITSNGGASWTTSPITTIVANGLVTMVDATTSYVAYDIRDVHRTAPAVSVPDYAATTADWASGNSLFGGCLQGVASAVAETWPVDVSGTAGECEPSDGDPWWPVPTTPTPIASTTAIGAIGGFNLVFGMHAGAGQPAAEYAATINVEVVAPAV